MYCLLFFYNSAASEHMVSPAKFESNPDVTDVSMDVSKPEASGKSIYKRRVSFVTFKQVLPQFRKRDTFHLPCNFS